VVDYRRQFLISFGGLKLGNHQLDFEIDSRFFEEFEYSEYKTGSLKVVMGMEKQQRMLILDFSVLGSVEVICDRCLDPFPPEINGKHKLFVKFGSDSHKKNNDVIVIPENETRFDVGHYIYEYIVLSVPIRHVHPENEDGISGCDPEVLKKMEEIKVTEKADPRWDALKKLKK